MFSRIFRRNTNIPTQNPVQPQVHGSEITDPAKIQSSGSQREDHVNNPSEIQLSVGTQKQLEDGVVSKYCRFVLEHENTQNEWNLQLN